MGKQLDKIKQIQKLQQQFTKLTSDLFEVIKDEPVTNFKKEIMEYIMRQQRLNTKFSVDLLMIIPREVDKDRFDRIVKPLEKDFGGENDKQT